MQKTLNQKITISWLSGSRLFSAWRGSGTDIMGVALLMWLSANIPKNLLQLINPSTCQLRITVNLFLDPSLSIPKPPSFTINCSEMLCNARYRFWCAGTMIVGNRPSFSCYSITIRTRRWQELWVLRLWTSLVVIPFRETKVEQLTLCIAAN